MVSQGTARNAPVDVPSKMQALISTGDKTAEVKETEVPKPGEGEILVKVHYVAQVSFTQTSVAGINH
jgi:NADPH-dependent curcumin reductase CurA